MGAAVELVPWDFTSQEHYDRLFKQRVACGWKSEELPMYKKRSEEGMKVMYWLVLPQDRPDRGELLASHHAHYPEEAATLQDTAQTEFLSLGPRRSALIAPFQPVGHIAIDLKPEEDAKLGLPASGGVVWIAQLYISYALQRAGLGSAALRAAERRAAADPALTGAGGEVVSVLDAIPESFQMNEQLIDEFYISRGNPPPAQSNEAWYKKQGYMEFAHIEKAFLWHNPSTDKPQWIPFKYFKKTLPAS